jgi:hypothetical protein
MSHHDSAALCAEFQAKDSEIQNLKTAFAILEKAANRPQRERETKP